MSVGVLVGILAIALVALGVVISFWRRELAQRIALEMTLGKVRAELEKYAPIKDIEAETLKRRFAMEQELATIGGEVARQKTDLSAIEARLREYELRLDLEEMGYYQPKFTFEDAQQYADALELVREAQKELVRQKAVLLGVTPNTSSAVKGLGKLAVSAFNGEARVVTDAVTYSNFEGSKEKLRVAFERINNLIEGFGITLSPTYLDFKIREMALAYDYQEAERKAQEEQAQIKAMMREEEEARVEAERAREKAQAEEERYQAALEKARAELASRSTEERASYEEKIRDLEAKLQQAVAERERATSMAQITRKGHVYIISNIGSFGENVFKIGMTRRLKPEERIQELGDASVPFGFDVHALINADDAPALELSLHEQFHKQRMNKVNERKEFFRVSIDDIAGACQTLGLSVQLTKLAEARDYRATRSIESDGGLGTGLGLKQAK